MKRWIAGLWIMLPGMVQLSQTGLAADHATDRIAVEALESLPQAVSNNAVALTSGEDGYRLYSVLGIGPGKTWKDIGREAWRYSAAAGRWSAIAPAPGPRGRLAATAVTAGGDVYLFGGYTVAEDGAEVSTPEVFRLDEAAAKWLAVTTMPVPVDDAVALVYQDRYIYLISGWHDRGNVNLVQVLDTKGYQWAQATPYPGAPVFGHAGGISGARLVICDGVRIAYQKASVPREFLPSAQCWRGSIEGDDYRRIDWHPLAAHPGVARYRMAAGSDDAGRIWFAGGSANPYNFDGQGYDGNPSEPEAEVFSYDLGKEKWDCHGPLAVATMDHRGLPWHEGWFYIIGGMRSGQEVSAGVFRFRPAPPRACAD
jgi:hypothetical protein